MKLHRSLYFWIFLGFIGGSLTGLFYPAFALRIAPLGSYFVKLITCFITPIVFLTIITGIARTSSFKQLGKVGIRGFIYFEVPTKTFFSCTVNPQIAKSVIDIVRIKPTYIERIILTSPVSVYDLLNTIIALYKSSKALLV